MSDYLCCCCCCYCTDKVEDEGHVKCPGKPEWISTKNQLPDVSDHYLAYFVIEELDQVVAYQLHSIQKKIINGFVMIKI